MHDEKFAPDYFRDYERKGSLTARHGERPYWYGFWERCISSRLSHAARILECGCGLGFFLSRIQDKYQTVGSDVSLYALDSAQQNAPKSKVLGASADQLPFANGSFEMVAAFDLIEHLESPDIFSRDVYRVLKPRGYLIFSTPNPQSFGARIKGRRREWRGKPQEERVAEWHGWRDDTHVSILSVDGWRRLLHQAGFFIDRDGTSGLHDIPYFMHVPLRLQKAVFTTTFVALTATVGFLPWRYGETYMCCARKRE